MNSTRRIAISAMRLAKKERITGLVTIFRNFRRRSGEINNLEVYTLKKVQFTETVLRDANQSLMATRLPYAD